jgi:hypothetical protein
MCANNDKEKPWGSIRKASANLLSPIPPSKKIQKFSRNVWIRLVQRQLCCGHPGEPGC